MNTLGQQRGRKPTRMEEAFVFEVRGEKRPIKVIEIDFALQGELMEKVKQVDGGCYLLN